MIPLRLVVASMFFTAGLILYMQTVNISINLLAMVEPRKNVTRSLPECIIKKGKLEELSANNTDNLQQYTLPDV